jgi:hypothetical protein
MKAALINGSPVKVLDETNGQFYLQVQNRGPADIRFDGTIGATSPIASGEHRVVCNATSVPAGLIVNTVPPGQIAMFEYTVHLLR